MIIWTRTARKSFSGRAEDVEKIDSLAETELLENDEMYRQNYQHQSHEQHHQISYQQYQGHFYRQKQGAHYAGYQHEDYRQYSPQDRLNSVSDSRQRTNHNDKENKTDHYNLDYYMAERDESERGHSKNKRHFYSPNRSRYEERRVDRRGSSSRRRYSNSPRRSYRSSSPRGNSSGSTSRGTRRHRIREYRRSRSKSSSSSTRSESASSVSSNSPARNSSDKRNVKINDKNLNRGYSSKQPNSVISRMYEKKYADSFSRGNNRRNNNSEKESTKVEVTIGDLTMSPISSDDFSQRSEEAESEADKEDMLDRKLQSKIDSDSSLVSDTDNKKTKDSKSSNNLQKVIIENTTKNGKKREEISEQQEDNFVTLEKYNRRIINVTDERHKTLKSKRKSFEKGEKDGKTKTKTKSNLETIPKEMSQISNDECSGQSEEPENEVNRKLPERVKSNNPSVNHTDKNKTMDSKSSIHCQQVVIEDTIKIGNKKAEKNEHQEKKSVTHEKDKSRAENVADENLKSHKNKRTSFEKGESVKNKTKSNLEKNSNELENCSSVGSKKSVDGTKKPVTGIKNLKNSEICGNFSDLTNLTKTVSPSSSIQSTICNDVNKTSVIDHNNDDTRDKNEKYNDTKTEHKKKGSFQELKDTLLQSNMDNEMVDKIVLLMASKSKSNKESALEQTCSPVSKILEKSEESLGDSHVNKKSSEKISIDSSKTEHLNEKSKHFENKGIKTKVRNAHVSESDDKVNSKQPADEGFEVTINKMKQSESRKRKEDTNQTIIDEHPFTKRDTFVDKEINELKQKVKEVANVKSHRMLVDKSSQQDHLIDEKQAFIGNKEGCKTDSEISHKKSDRQNGITGKVGKIDEKQYNKSNKRLDKPNNSQGKLSNDKESKSLAAQDLNQSKSHTLSLSDKRKFFEARMKSNDKDQNKVQVDMNVETKKDIRERKNHMDKTLSVSLNRIDVGKFSQQMSPPSNKSVSLSDKESSDDSKRKSVSEIVDNFNNAEGRICEDLKSNNNSKGKSVSAIKISNKNSVDLESSNDSRKNVFMDVMKSKQKQSKVSEIKGLKEIQHSSVKERKESHKSGHSRVKESHKKRKLSGLNERNTSKEREKKVNKDGSFKERELPDVQENSYSKERKISDIKEGSNLKENKKASVKENNNVKEQRISGSKGDVNFEENRVSYVKKDDNFNEKMSNVKDKVSLKERQLSSVKDSGNLKERRKPGVNDESKVMEMKMSGVKDNDNSNERGMFGEDRNGKIKEKKMSGYSKDKNISSVKEDEYIKQHMLSGDNEDRNLKESITADSNNLKELRISGSAGNIKLKERKMPGVIEDGNVKEKKKSTVEGNDNLKERKMSRMNESHNKDGKISRVVENTTSRERKMSGMDDFENLTEGNQLEAKTSDKKEKMLSEAIENNSSISKEIRYKDVESKARDRKKSGGGESPKAAKGNDSRERRMSGVVKSPEAVKSNDSRERRMSGVVKSPEAVKSNDSRERRMSGVGKSPEAVKSNDSRERRMSGVGKSPTAVKGNDSRERRLSGVGKSPEAVKSNDSRERRLSDVGKSPATVKGNDSRERRLSGVGKSLEAIKGNNDLRERKMSGVGKSPEAVKSNDSRERRMSGVGKSPEAVKSNDSRERKLSGIIENSNLMEGNFSDIVGKKMPKERRSFEIGESQDSRGRRLSGVAENRYSKERRNSSIGDQPSTRKRHGSESAPPIIVKGTTNRPSFGVYIPLGKPTEKRKLTPPAKQVSAPQVPDFDNTKVKDQTEPIKEVETALQTEVNDEDIGSREPEKNVKSGEAADTGPKRNLFGKNKRRISHFNDKDAKSVKTSDENRTNLFSTCLTKSPLETNNDYKTKLTNPLMKESPAKRPKISHENKKKLLRSFIRESPVKRQKHPFKQFPINKYSNRSPVSKQIKNINVQEESSRINENSNETSNSRTKPSESPAVLSPIDNIFEKMEENTFDRNVGKKVNDGKNRPVVKRVHEDSTIHTIGKKRKKDDTISEKSTKGSNLVGSEETYDQNFPNSIKADDQSDRKVAENNLQHQKSNSKSKSNKRKVEGDLLDNRSTPKASKSAHKVYDEMNFSSSDASKREKSADVKADKTKDISTGCDEEVNKLKNDKSEKHDKSEAKIISSEMLFESVKEVLKEKETKGCSEIVMQEHSSNLNLLSNSKSSEVENLTEKQGVLNLSEKQNETEVTCEEKVPKVQNIVSAKVKRLFKDKHRKNILSNEKAKEVEKTAKLENIQTNEIKNNDTQRLNDKLAESPVRNTSVEASSGNLKHSFGDNCTSKESETLVPNVKDADCDVIGSVVKHLENSAEENKKIGIKTIGENKSKNSANELTDNRQNIFKAYSFDAVNDKMKNSENLCEKVDNEMEQNNDDGNYLLRELEEDTTYQDSDSDMDDIEPIQLMGFAFMNDVSAEEKNESIISDSEINMKCSETCPKTKYSDDSVIIHNCVKYDSKIVIGNGNVLDGDDKSVVNKGNHLENASDRCYITERVVGDSITNTKTINEDELTKGNENELTDFNRSDVNESTRRSNLPNRLAKNAVRKRFTSQLNILGKKIEEETDTELNEINRSEEEMRDIPHSKYQKTENTGEILSDDNDDADLISSGSELTPSKQTKTTEWLKKAKTNVKVPTNLMSQNAFQHELEFRNDSSNAESKVTKLSIQIATTCTTDTKSCEENLNMQRTPTQFFQPWNDAQTTKSQVINHNSVEHSQEPCSFTKQRVHQSQQIQPCNYETQKDQHSNRLLQNSGLQQFKTVIHQRNTISGQEGYVASSIQNVSNTPMLNALTAKLVNEKYPAEINDGHTSVRNQSNLPVISNGQTSVPVNMSQSVNISQAKEISQTVQKAPCQLESNKEWGKNVNSPTVHGEIEMSVVQEPVKSDFNLKQHALKEESNSASEAFSRQTLKTAVHEASTELRKLALYKELCALDNIKTGDVGLDIMLLAEKSYLRGMMMINKDILNSAEALSKKSGPQQTSNQKEQQSIEERAHYLGQLKQKKNE
ncbi:repetitive organellar protein-like isoform X2 [Ruditapes philippinarum]|uniref:repetitive organellar protein-like isoform X2 n=1 Tax=Ruditapes philippinarum TaxID=129788 RepID=UPI00295A62B2|nr:repetitive organellar protein-like isoform X2 [Ruditapes philippinarum]